MKPQSLIKLILALLVVRILLAALTPVFDTSEARYAAISANMARSNDFLVPHFTYNHVYQSFDGKPPLLFQAAGLSVKAFGVNEFAVRLPVFLASALFLLLVFRVTLNLSNGNRTRAGLAALLTLASTVFYTQAGFCMTDGLLVPCVAGAILCHAAFLKTRERNWTWGVFALLGLGMLVKGPVALVEFGIPVALDLAANRRWACLRAYRWLTGGALFLLIAAPWFILMTRENPDFLRYFFIHENLLRFLVHDYGDKYGAGRETFRGMALVWTLVATLPWSPFVLTEIFKRKLGAPLRTAGPEALLLWGVLGITGFWCLTSRVPLTYVMPVIPLAAVWAALALEAKAPSLFNRLAPAFAALTVVVLVSGLLWGIFFTTRMKGADAPYKKNHYSYEFYHGPLAEAIPK